MIKLFKIITLFSKKNISLFIYFFINFIFSAKYLSRVTNYYLIASIFLTIFYIIIWKYKNIFKKTPIVLSELNIILISVFILGSFFVFKKVAVETLNVDRWSVINSFWDSYFNNQYVYFAKSNVGNPPGPMPFYFILALPFYFFGELGWFSVMGIILFFVFLKYSKTSKLNITAGLLLTLISIFYLWEVVSRSNMFLNGSLILFVLYYYLNIEKINIEKITITGLLIGISISTRNVLIIPFVIAFIYQLKNNLIKPKQFLLLGLISILTFIVTFIPFVYNNFQSFKIMNPFLIQSSALVPFEYTLLFILIAFITGIYCKSIKDIYFFSGLVLFISIVIYFLYHINLVGFKNTFFGSDADISYFILCTPFSLFYVLSSKKTT